MHQWRIDKGWHMLALAILLMVSCTSMALGGTTGELVDDAIITTKVKSSFVADPTVSALAINVDTAQGVVSLTGVVNTEEERQRAIQLAQGVEGVKRVDARNLVVKR